METTIWQIATPLCGGLGFGLRYLFERNSEKKKESVKLAIEETRFRLEMFYMPIYFLLKEEKHLWKHFRSQEEISSEDFRKYDTKNLEILIKIQEVIKTNIVKARPTPKMSQLIVDFDEYVTTYRTMREIDPTGKNFPSCKFGIPYPVDFLKNIRVRVRELGTHLNKLCIHIDDLYEVKLEDYNLEIV
jgi:hypothetical protein